MEQREKPRKTASVTVSRSENGKWAYEGVPFLDLLSVEVDESSSRVSGTVCAVRIELAPTVSAADVQLGEVTGTGDLAEKSRIKYRASVCAEIRSTRSRLTCSEGSRACARCG